jgi:hypothetical protein
MVVRLCSCRSRAVLRANRDRLAKHCRLKEKDGERDGNRARRRRLLRDWSLAEGAMDDDRLLTGARRPGKRAQIDATSTTFLVGTSCRRGRSFRR